MMRNSRAFTLVELLIAIAVAAILMTLAAPSFRDFILMQRLKGISAQLTTDLQFARSEAAAIRQSVRMRFSEDDDQTCYMLFTGPAGSCNCTTNPRCTAAGREIRTAAVPKSLDVRVVVPVIAGFAMMRELEFDHATGGVVVPPGDEREAPPPRITVDAKIDDRRNLRTELAFTGRPRTCSPAGSIMGAPAC